MKFKINRELFPIKAHFFFFFAALGPILPQLNVFGRQLGVSPGAMGLVTSVLPILWALAKPCFGYVVDFFPSRRKLVFVLLIIIMTGSYCCLWFLPMPKPTDVVTQHIFKINGTIQLKETKMADDISIDKYHCLWNCENDTSTIYLSNTTSRYDCLWNCQNDTCFTIYLPNTTYIDTIYTDRNIYCASLSMVGMASEKGPACALRSDCDLKCYEDGLRKKGAINGSVEDDKICSSQKEVKLASTSTESSNNFYVTSTFWVFVVLMCVGTVAFNVANCIGDAVCFDVLGPDRASKYGSQRAWGTVGYGLTALAGGCLIDLYSSESKDFTPAFVIALAATAVDLYSCRRLTLPALSSPEDSGRALREVLRIPRVLLFITFAVVAGAFDSFIIYYMFWFLEELAEETGQTARIKLIEGVVVAGQSFIGELLFFFLSGRIIKRWGYGTTLTVCLLCYGVRMALISLIQHPWHLVFIESVMQGPTYALCYSTIVGYAAHVAPEGYSATVQGIVAGMDDGLGFAVGSLAGGQLYAWAGGRSAFRIFACVALAGSLLHAALFAITTDSGGKKQKETQEVPEGEKMLTEHTNAIYKETVQPVTEQTLPLTYYKNNL